MKKKLLITLLALTMAVSSAACTSSKNTSKTDKTEKKATESVAESVTETSTESTAVNEAVKGQESSEVSDTAGVKADDSIAAGAVTTDSRADSDNGSSSAGTSADKEKSGKKAKDNKKSASTASAAGSKGTDSSSGTANKPAAHTHTWVKYVANTIQHKEEGHYETKVVKEAYDEPQYDWHNVCNKCGYDMGTNIENVVNHEDICDGSYSCIQVQVGTIHHDAETTQVWVVDKPAYTEYVYGEKCSGCGATK